MQLPQSSNTIYPNSARGVITQVFSRAFWLQHFCHFWYSHLGLSSHLLIKFILVKTDLLFHFSCCLLAVDKAGRGPHPKATTEQGRTPLFSRVDICTSLVPGLPARICIYRFRSFGLRKLLVHLPCVLLGCNGTASKYWRQILLWWCSNCTLYKRKKIFIETWFTWVFFAEWRRAWGSLSHPALSRSPRPVARGHAQEGVSISTAGVPQPPWAVDCPHSQKAFSCV